MPKGPCTCGHSVSLHKSERCSACTCTTYKPKQYPPPAGKCDIGTIRLPVAVRDRLDAIAQRDERSRNQVVVWLLKKALGMKRNENSIIDTGERE